MLTYLVALVESSRDGLYPIDGEAVLIACLR